MGLILVVLGFVLAHAAVARAAPAGAVEAMKRDTRVLSSDAFEGRGPLTRGGARTVRYLTAAMRAAGLEPGFHAAYVQPVPLLQTETLTATPPRLRVFGPSGVREFAYGRDVTLNTHRHAPRVRLQGSDIVFVGYGVNAPERYWNDYAGVDVRGKTVLILVNDPDWRNPVGEGAFGGAAMTFYGRWMYKYEEAARQGAAAAIIIHSDAAAGYPFSVVSSSLGGARVSLDRPDGGAGLLAAESWITRAAAQRLVGLAGFDLDQLEAEASRPGFRARPLGLAADIGFAVRARRSVSFNVAGRLTGSRRPGETIIYTAHWDHLGRCPPDARGDTICNGAVDNATGVAGLLELARMYRRAPRTARSILFLATTGEEYGLLGSEYYAAHPIAPMAKTVADLDLDPLSFMLGPTRDIALIADQTELAPIVRAAASAQGRIVTSDTAPEQGARYRSDTLSFARAGTPVVLLGSGVEVTGRPAGWGKAKLADYFAHRYHQPSDAYDPDWDWRGAVQDLDLMYAVGRTLAKGGGWPNWYPGDEFRAARDGIRESVDKTANPGRPRARRPAPGERPQGRRGAQDRGSGRRDP